MNKLIIKDSKDGFLDFDLIDLLNIVGERVKESRWKVFNVEAVGKDADELHKISDDELVIDGSTLLKIASELMQVIEGVFEGFFHSSDPWIIIRAIDSSEFEVETNSTSVLSALREHFHNTE